MAKIAGSLSVGLLLSLLALWWIAPTTSSGAIFLVVLVLVTTQAIGGFVLYALHRKTVELSSPPSLDGRPGMAPKNDQ